jgi:hypothetical protein
MQNELPSKSEVVAKALAILSEANQYLSRSVINSEQAQAQARIAAAMLQAVPFLPREVS